MSLMLALDYLTASIGLLRLGFLNDDIYNNKYVIKIHVVILSSSYL